MTAKHTATPYGVAKYSPEHKGDGQMIYIASARKPINSNVCLVGMDTDPQHEADAAFIVKACNCHDDLLEALQDCMAGIDAVLKMAQQHDPSTGYLKGVSPFDILKVLQINPICVTARETLAKAKGE